MQATGELRKCFLSHVSGLELWEGDPPLLTGASASCTNKPKVVAHQDVYSDADGIHSFVAFCPRFFTEYQTHRHFDPLPGIPAPDPAKMGSNTDAMLDDGFTVNTSPVPVSFYMVSLEMFW